MPRKNKKKNRQQIEEENDWDKSDESDKAQMISSKDLKKKNKKNKKNKSKKQTQNQNECDSENQSQSNNAKPVQKLSKKQQKKLKKMKKYQEASPEPDWDAHTPSPPPQQKKKKGKKGKKNKNKKNKKAQRSEAEILAEKLLKLKQERQESLLSLGNSLMENLDMKYAPYFGEEVKLLWEDQILGFVEFYEEGYEDTAEDDELLNSKKEEMRAAWAEVFELISEDFEEAQTEKYLAKKEKDKLKKLENARALLGGNIGIGTRTKQATKAGKKQQKKKEEREKLRAIKARLQEMDRLAVEQEREKEELESLEASKREQARKEREARELKAKEDREAAQNDDWDDSSENSESEEEKPKKVNRRSKGKTVKKDAFESSDDEWGTQSKPKPKPKPKGKPKQKDAMNAFADSDEESQGQKKGRRRRKGKGKGNQSQNNSNNSTKKGKDNPKPEPKQTVPVKNQNKKSSKKQPKPRPEPEQKMNAKQRKKYEKEQKKKKGKLRSPICVVMGHVDHGKTKILDHIRNTSVQSKEAGGITQQIGATYLSIDYIKERTSRLKEQVAKLKYKIPGLLFIDTPGHESFSNLRSRGSSMCDIAVLVVDLMQGFQPQTIESLNMLKERKSPFVVALNKIDMCYDWKPDPDAPFLSTYKKQAKHTQNDFEHRLAQCKLAFNEVGLNAELYTKNKKMDKDISLVPTSAITGEGIPDLLYLIVRLTHKYMSSAISFSAHKSKCSVLEVKQTVGYGATIDVIVSNGTLRSDDRLVICGMNGPIVTDIKALLLPNEATEMRVKGAYKTVHSVTASVGVRIAAIEDLASAVAGSPLFIVPRKLKPKSKDRERRECVEALKDEVQASFTELFASVDKHGRGVFVQASTLGALEALIAFLTAQKIPICGIGIGAVSKKTVMKAAVMLNFQPEYAVVLAFNIKCSPDARVLAEEQGVRIFEAEIIYHLQEMFEKYLKDLKEERKKAAKDIAVFPCEFRILSAEHVFHNKNPFVFGVQIVRGSLRNNTPIVAQRWNAAKIATPLYLGKVDTIKSENKDVAIAKVGDKVSVRIAGDDEQKNIQVGRSFVVTDPLISEITRDSIDALKANFEEEMKEDNDCVQHLGLLKQYFNII